MSTQLTYTFCEHGHLFIPKLPFHCDECLKRDERARILKLLEERRVEPKDIVTGWVVPLPVVYEILQSLRIDK